MNGINTKRLNDRYLSEMENIIYCISSDVEILKASFINISMSLNSKPFMQSVIEKAYQNLSELENKNKILLDDFQKINQLIRLSKVASNKENL